MRGVDRGYQGRCNIYVETTLLAEDEELTFLDQESYR